MNLENVAALDLEIYYDSDVLSYSYCDNSWLLSENNCVVNVNGSTTVHYRVKDVYNKDLTADGASSVLPVPAAVTRSSHSSTEHLYNPKPKRHGIAVAFYRLRKKDRSADRPFAIL